MQKIITAKAKKNKKTDKKKKLVEYYSLYEPKEYAKEMVAKK
jgi:hypothetical protein